LGADRVWATAVDVFFPQELVPSVWQQFARYHVSRQFFDEVEALLGPHIKRLHPLKPNFRTGLRCESGRGGVGGSVG
jgi:hypothetical protein